MTKRATAITLMLVACARTAYADDDVDRVRTLYDEAGQLEKQGQWSAAQDRLKTALRIRDTAQLHYALGWAFENDDRLLEARTEYEAAVRSAKSKNVEEVARLATSRLEELEKITPEVRVQAANAHVAIDGKNVPSQGDEAVAKVDPGSRVIRVERDGRVLQQTIYVPRGVSRIVEVGKDTSVIAAEPSKSNALPWVLVGVGGAMVVGSVALFISSSSDASTRDSKQAQWCQATACTGTVATLPETDAAVSYRRDSQDAADRGNTKQIAGAVIGAVGLVGVAVGTVIMIKRSRETRSSASVMSVTGTPTPGGGFASASLSF